MSTNKGLCCILFLLNMDNIGREGYLATHPVHQYCGDDWAEFLRRFRLKFRSLFPSEDERHKRTKPWWPALTQVIRWDEEGKWRGTVQVFFDPDGEPYVGNTIDPNNLDAKRREGESRDEWSSRISKYNYCSISHPFRIFPPAPSTSVATTLEN